MDSNFDPRELDADVEAMRLAASARAAYFAKAPPVRRWRDIQVVGASQPSADAGRGVGRSLISRRPAPRQKRYGPGFADFAFTLTGLPGRERLIALATAAPFPGLPAPTPRAVFASLSPADLDRITDATRRLPADQWSAAACEFTIET